MRVTKTIRGTGEVRRVLVRRALCSILSVMSSHRRFQVSMEMVCFSPREDRFDKVSRIARQAENEERMIIIEHSCVGQHELRWLDSIHAEVDGEPVVLEPGMLNIQRFPEIQLTVRSERQTRTAVLAVRPGELD